MRFKYNIYISASIWCIYVEMLNYEEFIIGYLISFAIRTVVKNLTIL